jgi:hypothetical protein
MAQKRKAGNKKRAFSPKYLPKKTTDKELIWLGNRLKQAREKLEKPGTSNLERIAAAAGVKPDDIKALEGGTSHVNLGNLWKIIKLGYNENLQDLIAECYEANKSQSGNQTRRFKRDSYYSVRTEEQFDKLPTPMLVGGDPHSYLWAMPMRRLERQPMVVEFLELAPTKQTKFDKVGVIHQHFHDGVELIYVIYGQIVVGIKSAEDAKEAPLRQIQLKSGACIHFHSCDSHSIRNPSLNTNAFLFLVRIPELPHHEDNTSS